ncbi:hypothetical protein OSTOST_08848 [Ostertagia ostertagi]
MNQKQLLHYRQKKAQLRITARIVWRIAPNWVNRENVPVLSRLSSKQSVQKRVESVVTVAKRPLHLDRQLHLNHHQKKICLRVNARINSRTAIDWLLRESVTENSVLFS